MLQNTRCHQLQLPSNDLQTLTNDIPAHQTDHCEQEVMETAEVPTVFRGTETPTVVHAIVNL